MKTCTFVLAFATLLSSAIAAPAVVWQSSSSTAEISSSSNARSLHSSKDIHASELMKNVLTTISSSSSETSSEAPALSAVKFLIGKGEDGSEQLSELASGGKLPLTFAKYNDATGVYHSVSGVESTGSIVKVAGNAITIDGKNNNNKNKNNRRVLEVTLNEFNSKLTLLDTAAVVDPVAEVEIDSNGTPSSTTATSTNKRVTKRARALAHADIYIVNVNPTTDASTQIDTSIVQAIENKNVGSVVLGGIRSIEEVKHERFLTNQRRMTVMESNGNKIMDNRRRRLEIKLWTIA